MIVRHKFADRTCETVEKMENWQQTNRPSAFGIGVLDVQNMPDVAAYKKNALWEIINHSGLLGLDMDDETDELTSLSEYAARALDRAESGMPKDNIMCVIDKPAPLAYRLTTKLPTCVADVPPAVASTTAPKELFMYMQTPAKHGLTTTPVSVVASATKLSYHAIVYIPVPCEESCPVKAISKKTSMA